MKTRAARERHIEKRLPPLLLASSLNAPKCRQMHPKVAHSPKGKRNPVLLLLLLFLMLCESKRAINMCAQRGCIFVAQEHTRVQVVHSSWSHIVRYSGEKCARQQSVHSRAAAAATSASASASAEERQRSLSSLACELDCLLHLS